MPAPWPWGADDVLPDNSPLAIGNAILDAGTFTDTVGPLEVAGFATIHLNDGAALAFANSGSSDWSNGTLAITGSFVPGSSLRFGTDAGGLTTTQLGPHFRSGYHIIRPQRPRISHCRAGRGL
jgi:hypothetical protein